MPDILHINISSTTIINIFNHVAQIISGNPISYFRYNILTFYYFQKYFYNYHLFIEENK